MFLGSKFVYVGSGDEEEAIVTGNISSDEDEDEDDGKVRIWPAYFVNSSM
jgi:hypothetical protein